MQEQPEVTQEDIDQLMAKRDAAIAKLTLFSDMPNPLTITELDPPPPQPKASRSWSGAFG